MTLAEMPAWMAMEERQAEPTTIPRAENADAELADSADLDPYVRAALAGEVARVQAATEGARNDTLVRAAFSLGQLEQAGLTFEVARTALSAAARATGLKPTEINNTIKSGWKAGREKPRDLSGVLPVPHHLTCEQADLPAYPVEVLPEPAQAYVIGAAKAIGCPVELVAVPFLAYAGAAIGSRFAIELKRGFRQWPVLWVTSVAPTGSAKTPANEAARLPLEELQDEAQERFQAELAAYELAVAEREERRRAKKDRGEMSISSRFGGEEEATGKLERPKLEHYFTTDATIEALAEILSSSPGVALYRDELVGWVRSFDAYKGGRGGERQQHLSMWSSSTLKVDRKGKDPIIVKRPVAAVVGAVQPVVLPDLAEEVGRQDGFLERFMWSCPVTEAPRWTEETVPVELVEQATALFRSLRLPQEYPAQVFAPGVQEVWVEWFNNNAEIYTRSTGIMTGVHAKMPNQCARLCLILHCLRWAAEAPLHVIERETLDGAIALVEYHRAHAAFVFELLGQCRSNPTLRLQRRIEHILRGAGGAWLSRTDLDKALSGRVPASDRDAVLSRLAAAGMIEQQNMPSGSQGGHPAVYWRWVLGDEELEEPEKPEEEK